MTVDARSAVAATVAAWNSTHTGIVAEVQDCDGGGGGGFDTGASDVSSSDTGSSDTGSSDTGNGDGTTVVCDGTNCEAVEGGSAPRERKLGLFGCSAGGSEAGLLATVGLLAMMATHRRRRR
jgi:hypothetical protein